jgi:hypothetical protein
LEAKVRDEVPPAARALRQALKADNGYCSRLLDQICTAMQAAEPEKPRGWLKFDRELGILAAMLLADGRVGARTAERFALALHDAETAADAADALRAEVSRERQQFEVAVVISGASAIAGAEAFGFRSPGAPWCWAEEPHADSDGRLRSFLAPQVDGRQACGVIVTVSAYDAAHARQCALKHASELHDALHARYRWCRFTVDTTVLVRAADGTVCREGSSAGGVSVASPLTAAPVPALREALRYSGEARDHAMPVASITSAWIALQRLAKGARRRDRDRTEGPRQKPAAFLPKRAGSVMGLVAMRSVWPVSWHLAQMAGRESERAADWAEIERYLGVKGSFVPDLTAWARLLTAEDQSPRGRRHAALLNELADDFPTLVRVRPLIARDLLLHGQAFVDGSMR